MPSWYLLTAVSDTVIQLASLYHAKYLKSEFKIFKDENTIGLARGPEDVSERYQV